jgi:aryl-alcohol dehydrogenase-like predicted oxidoreductase
MPKLGQSNIEVTPLCLGGNVFGWTTDEEVSFKVLDTYVEEGGNFIDTADVYSAWIPGNQGGESEAILGKWMHQRKNRERVILATKVGSLNPDAPGKPNLSRRRILQAVEDSLHRLQTDYIDLYQAHRDDETTPLEETLATFAELVKQGKVRAIGASNYRAQRLSEALRISEQHGYPRYETLQPYYNLVARKDYESELEPLCLEQQISVIPYSSLASGFLSGKYRPGKELPKTPRAKGVQSRYWNDKSFAVLSEIDKIAERYHVTPTQIALAWLIGRPGLTAPIASATSIQQVRELMGTLKLQLDQDAITALTQASAGL